jgi:hypothetical protein
VGTPRSGAPSSGSPFLPHFFGEAKKRVGRRDEYPATPHGSRGLRGSPVNVPSSRRRCLCDGRPAAHETQVLRCAARLAGEARECALPDGVAGYSSRRPTYFSCFAKQSRQKKATPMMAVRAAHGLHTPPAPKSGSVGTRYAQTADASDPISALAACRHRRGITAESKATSKATATTRGGLG